MEYDVAVLGAGDHWQAVASCRRALLLRRLGDQAGEASAWDSIGFACHRVVEVDRWVRRSCDVDQPVSAR